MMLENIGFMKSVMTKDIPTVYIRYAIRRNLMNFFGQAPHFFDQNIDSEKKVPVNIDKEMTKPV